MIPNLYLCRVRGSQQNNTVLKKKMWGSWSLWRMHTECLWFVSIILVFNIHGASQNVGLIYTAQLNQWESFYRHQSTLSQALWVWKCTYQENKVKRNSLSTYYTPSHLLSPNLWQNSTLTVQWHTHWHQQELHSETQDMTLLLKKSKEETTTEVTHIIQCENKACFSKRTK